MHAHGLEGFNPRPRAGGDPADEAVARTGMISVSVWRTHHSTILKVSFGDDGLAVVKRKGKGGGSMKYGVRLHVWGDYAQIK